MSAHKTDEIPEARLFGIAIEQATVEMRRIDNLVRSRSIDADTATDCRCELRRLRHDLTVSRDTNANDRPRQSASALLEQAGTSAARPLLRDAIGEIQDAVSQAKKEPRKPLTGPLLAILTFEVLFMVCFIVLSWADENPWLIGLSKQSFLLPGIKGLLLIVQIGLIAGAVGFLYCIAKVFSSRIDNSMVGVAMDRYRAIVGATGGGEKAAPLLTALLSAKGLAVAAAASGVIVATAENHQQSPKPPAGPASNANRALERLDKEMTRLASIADKLADAKPHPVTVTFDKPVAVKLDPSELALKMTGAVVPSDARESIRQLQGSIAELNHESGAQKGRLEAISGMVGNLDGHSRLVDERIWTLCFETHKLTDALPTLRNGLVGYGAGEDPAWAKLNLDCGALRPSPAKQRSPSGSPPQQ